MPFREHTFMHRNGMTLVRCEYTADGRSASSYPHTGTLDGETFTEFMWHTSIYHSRSDTGLVGTIIISQPDGAYYLVDDSSLDRIDTSTGELLTVPEALDVFRCGYGRDFFFDEGPFATLDEAVTRLYVRLVAHRLTTGEEVVK